MDIEWLKEWVEQEPTRRSWVIRGCIAGGYRVRLEKFKDGHGGSIHVAGLIEEKGADLGSVLMKTESRLERLEWETQ